MNIENAQRAWHFKKSTLIIQTLIIQTLVIQRTIVLTALAVLIAATLATLATPANAFQSGSRGGSSGGSGSTSSAPAFSSPSASFSTPSSVLGTSSPAVGFPTQSVQGFQGQQFPVEQFPGQQFSSQQFPAQQFSGQQFSQQGFATPQSAPAQASPGSSLVPASSVVDPIFEINDPYSGLAVDHSAWDRFLSCYLVTDQQGLNRIHYGRVSYSDRQQLQGYLGYLQSVDVRTLNRSEQLAYWFNLYNAKTVDVVLENYPIRSVREIKESFTDFVGPFDDEGAVNVLGKSLSLNDIESGIVRPVFNDPRIHYALNCASFGCPNVATRAWTSANLDARLNAAAANYINSGRAVKSGLFGVRVAKIFKWYKDDFGGSDQAVIAHLQQYANPSTYAMLQNAGGRIGGYFYDWSLNDAKIQRRRLLESIIR